MKITLLGTGTSQGIPVIGCHCDVCTSDDIRDNRRRCSVLIESEGATVVIDVGPDFRMQMLDASVDNLDAVLITHEHNDHIIGLDDLRPLLFRSKGIININGESRVLDEIKHRFEYAFTPQPYPGAPEFHITEIEPLSLTRIGDMEILPLRILHGNLPILGYRIGSFAYLTDTNFIPDSTLSELGALDVLVIDALRMKSHHSHFSLLEAIDIIKVINPQRAFLTHISHLMGRTKVWEKLLPQNIFPSYDGLQFDL